MTETEMERQRVREAKTQRGRDGGREREVMKLKMFPIFLGGRWVVNRCVNKINQLSSLIDDIRQRGESRP